MNKIIVPTDFTIAANTAIKQAVHLALKTQSDIVLLHVVDDKSPSTEESEKTLRSKADEVSEKSGLKCDILLKTGNIFDVIANEPCKANYDIMVIGTHGIKGVRQKIFGADILKLVSKVPIPVLIVQEDSPLVKIFHKIVLPVSSHNSFINAVNSVLLIAGICNAEVHLYSINKPGYEWPEQMKKNISLAQDIFNKKGIQVIRVKEEQTVFSMGYAKQTLNYAKSINADGISMISLPSDEYYYFAHPDKEIMIENEFRIPILCSGGGKEDENL